MPDKYTIRLISKNTHDQLVMKSILGIIGQRACKNWSYSEDNSTADVVIVDVDKEYPDVVTLQKTNHCHTIVSWSETARYVPQMSFSLSKPLRAKDLLVLLSDIEHTLSVPTSVPVVSKIPPKVSTDVVQKAFSSSKALDQLLVAIKQYKGEVVEIDLGNQRLYLDNRRKKIFANGSLVVSQLAQRQVVCRPVDKVPLMALESLTFTDMFYDLTLAQPSVNLANDLSANHEFAIKQWPNMGNSRHAKSMMRMAAYFSKQKATVNKAANDLAIELNHIIGFINAVHSQDLLVSYPAMALPHTRIEHNTSHAQSAPTKNTSGLGGLFGRIRQRLGM